MSLYRPNRYYPLDEITPFVQCFLKDESKLIAAIPPLSLPGPIMTIIKAPKKNSTFDDLVREDYLSQEMSEFLQYKIRNKANFYVSGLDDFENEKLLSVMASSIPTSERIMAIESNNLQLRKENSFSLFTQQPGQEGDGEIFIRDIIKYAASLQAERILYCQREDISSIELLQSMANQFSGSICSIRAKTPMGVISQLTSSALINNKNLNQEIVSYIISKAIDYIVHVGKLHDGPKKITSITKVSQLNKTTIHLEDIFIYMMKNTSAQNETVGQFVSTIIK